MTHAMNDQQVAHTPLSLYCSYADADQRLKQELEKQLKILLDQHVITFWSHDQVQLGGEMALVMQEQLQVASVVLLLLSPDFFTSDQCQREMEHALDRLRIRTARIFLILVRPCPWQLDTRLRDLPVLPELTEPVTLWRNRDQAWLSIAQTLCLQLRIEASASAPRRPAIFQVRDLPPEYTFRAQLNLMPSNAFWSAQPAQERPLPLRPRCVGLVALERRPWPRRSVMTRIFKRPMLMGFSG